MNYSVVISEQVDQVLQDHLIREDGQEDLCFALYKLSTGRDRVSAVISEVILPLEGDRAIHGNVEFFPQYWDRVCSIALSKGYGICFMHSHPYPGWQRMSNDDMDAESMLSPRCFGTTEMPLVGLTTGNDGTWSARFWIKEGPRDYKRNWCESVRVVGKGFKIDFANHIKPPIKFGEELTRTISAWGSNKQNELARLRIGVVGLGSVGASIAEALRRTGIHDIRLIDFDLVERKNLDRLQGIGTQHINMLKVDAVKERLETFGIYSGQNVETFPHSITEKDGLEAALDCDILFSCVDRPLPRYVLDMIAYAHHIPVIDGGIDATYSEKHDNLFQARIRTHVVAPSCACMQCLGQYKPEDVALEANGDLDNPKYIEGLPDDHFINHGENVYTFSIGCAFLEMSHLLSYILQPKKIIYGPREYDYVLGTVDRDFLQDCKLGCSIKSFHGLGDNVNGMLVLPHPVAEESRKKALLKDSDEHVVELRLNWFQRLIRKTGIFGF